MKGYFVWILVILSALMVAGCRSEAESTAPAIQTVSNPAATTTPAPLAQESLLNQSQGGNYIGQ